MHMLHVVKVSKIQNEFELYDTEPGSLDIEFLGACLFFLVSFSDMYSYYKSETKIKSELVQVLLPKSLVSNEIQTFSLVFLNQNLFFSIIPDHIS